MRRGASSGGLRTASARSRAVGSAPSGSAKSSSMSSLRLVNSQPGVFGPGNSSSCARAAPLRRRSVNQVGSAVAVAASANRALHLELDQAGPLDRVLHRQLLGDRLDEPVDDHLGGLLLLEPAALEVEDL